MGESNNIEPNNSAGQKHNVVRTFTRLNILVASLCVIVNVIVTLILSNFYLGTLEFMQEAYLAAPVKMWVAKTFVPIFVSVFVSAVIILIAYLVFKKAVNVKGLLLLNLVIAMVITLTDRLIHFFQYGFI